jgi:hypothetical protein
MAAVISQTKSPSFQGYQCAYPGGACTWQDITGALQNTHQTNCLTTAACPSTGCACPIDNNLDTGVLINIFKGYQCAYHGGACTWDSVSSFNTAHHSEILMNPPDRRSHQHPPDQLPYAGCV